MEQLDFPLWLRLSHFINILFISLLIRSGIQIFFLHPVLYWKDNCSSRSIFCSFAWLRKNSGGLIGQECQHAADSSVSQNKLADSAGSKFQESSRNWHYFSVVFWCLNGLVYVCLLFFTGEWQRIIPASSDIFPQAIASSTEWMSLHIPHHALQTCYDPMQQLAYFTVVFVLSPLAILSGAACSVAVSAKAPWYPALFGGRQLARSIHTFTLVAYLLFVVIHTLMLMFTGFAENMNRIVLGRAGSDCTGILLGVAALALVAVLHFRITRKSLDFENDHIFSKLVRPLFAAANAEFSPLNLTASAKTGSAELPKDCPQDPEAIREKIRQLLEDENLPTQMQPFPEDSRQFENILVELRKLESTDLKGKLIIAGFYKKPVNGTQCFECIYYKAHSKICDLPELNLPVEPHWWCRLWRI